MLKYYEFDVTYQPERRQSTIIVEHKDIHTEKLAWQFAIMRAFDERKHDEYVGEVTLIKRIVREEG